MTLHPAKAFPVKDMITGISASLLIYSVTAFLPLLGFFVALVLPLPMVYFRLKLGRAMGMVMLALTFSLVSLVSGGISMDMLFLGNLLLTGFFLGEYIEQRLSIEKTVIYTCLTVMGITTAVMMLKAMAEGQGLLVHISAYITANLEMSLKLYESLGVSKESLDTISGSLDVISYVMIRIMPSLVATSLMFVTWVNVLFIKKILSQKGIRLPHLDALNRWRSPEMLVWLVILSGLCLMISFAGVKLAGLNIIIVFMLIYFFQGIGIVSFYFEKKRFPRAAVFFIYSIIALQQIFLLVIVGLGFFDTWADFRKIGTAEGTDNSSSSD